MPSAAMTSGLLVALALACTHRNTVTHLAILDAPMPGWSEWEALFADPAIEDLEEFARSLAQPGNTRGGLEWYRAFPVDHANALAWKREPLAIPVLALGGDHRYGPTIVAMLEEFATDVSGGSVTDCAHWLPEERAAETAGAVLKFLAR
jgi:pimeloyl-ACP methyl ester carboxylesterase